MTLNEDKIRSIIRFLRKQIGLLLAGFDVVIDNVTGNHAVIDINVFPSYDNFPDFFEHFLDCIDELVNRTDGESNSSRNGVEESHLMNGLMNVALAPTRCGVTGMNVD